MRHLWLVFAGLALQTAPVAAGESISWGPPVNGLRLGVAIRAASGAGSLRLGFQNAGAKQMDVLWGGKTGTGPMYAMKFAVTDPRGNERQVFYFGGANSVGGYIEPLLVRLLPGETYDLFLPLNKFVCVVNRKDIMLDVLLKNGYPVRASLEVSPESATWARSNATWRSPAEVWTGKVESGGIRLPPVPEGSPGSARSRSGPYIRAKATVQYASYWLWRP